MSPQASRTCRTPIPRSQLARPGATPIPGVLTPVIVGVCTDMRRPSSASTTRRACSMDPVWHGGKRLTARSPLPNRNRAGNGNPPQAPVKSLLTRAGERRGHQRKRCGSNATKSTTSADRPQRGAACGAGLMRAISFRAWWGSGCGERSIVAADYRGLFAVGLRRAALGQARRIKKRSGARSIGLHAEPARTAAAGVDQRAGLSRLHDGAWLDAATARRQQTVRPLGQAGRGCQRHILSLIARTCSASE